MWDGSFFAPRCNSQLFCSQSSGRSLHISSRSGNVTVVQKKEFIVWPFTKNSLWIIPLMSKKNDEHALDFSLHWSRLLRSRWVSAFCVRLMLSCLIIVRVSVAPFPRFAQNLMLLFWRIHHEIASRPDTRLQLNGSKKLAAWNVVHWLQRYAITIPYRYIALLELLYRWQH
jgi:hypothetical protein